MKTKAAILFLLLLCAAGAFAQDKPALSEIDRIRLAEAFRIGDKLGDRVWQSWNKAPFAVLLVTADYEFLIRHPKPSTDFSALGYDSLLKSRVYYRKRVYQTSLLATFPAVGGISTIVVGQAENTYKKTSTPWVITLLHEHFHQMQASKPDYNPAVAALNLSGGDQTGMWMLNYDFPYTNETTALIYGEMAKMLAGILKSDRMSGDELSEKVKNYLKLREKLKQSLSPEAYRYFSFQIWQEGIARYTEHRISDLTTRKYKPGRAFTRLGDFTPFEAVEKEIRLGNLNELSALSLPVWKRVSFYSLGAGEGLLLDKTNPKWHDRYFTEKFYLENYFEKAD